MELKPWETTGMVVLQAESEISSINMVYGGASTGKRVMTSSSSPGISLMSEGLSYLAGAELPCLVVNCQRGGPGLGTIQPSQGDYFQACKGGGHGDFHLIVLAPNSVQEMHDHVAVAFDLAFKYRNPAIWAPCCPGRWPKNCSGHQPESKRADAYRINTEIPTFRSFGPNEGRSRLSPPVFRSFRDPGWMSSDSKRFPAT